MVGRSKNYKTKQKQEILNFLKSLENSHFTVQQISNHLQEIGNPVGLTTIYRHLDKFVSEGIVKKYVLDGKTSACFEYIDCENLKSDIHFHFKCNKCGDLIHFECEELQNLYIHLLEEHKINIDLSKTIYYGICDRCSKL